MVVPGRVGAIGQMSRIAAKKDITMYRAVGISALVIAMLPVSVAADGVRITGAPATMPLENDFSRNLPDTLISGATLALTERSRLIFTAVAAESGHHNTLTVQGLGSLSEDRDFGFRRGSQQRIVGEFAPGQLDSLLAFTSDFGDPAVPGSGSFGAFVDGAPGQEFTTFYLVYDDEAGTDGDFDDYIIRVDVQPLE